LCLWFLSVPPKVYSYEQYNNDDSEIRNPLIVNHEGVYPYANWYPWSPTGENLVYVFPETDIHIYNTSIGEAAEYTGESPVWSSDGSHILCSRKDGIYLISVDGESEEKIVAVDSPKLKTVSPSGSGFAYTINDEFYHSNIYGTTSTLIGQYDPALVSYLPDGTTLLFSGPYTATGQSYYGIWKVGSDGTGLEQFIEPHTDDASNELAIYHMNVASDGTYAIYCDYLGAWKLNMADSTEELLYRNVWHADVSPDGTRLCYVKRSSQDYYDHTELHIANIDGSDDVKLLTCPQHLVHLLS